MSNEENDGVPNEEPGRTGLRQLSPIPWIADLLGCSEGRVYTILIGLVLSLSMARFAYA